MAFTPISRKRVMECHKDLQTLAYELEKIYPTIQVSCGSRGKEAQEIAFKRGASNAHYGESPHNCSPISMAIDFVFVVGGVCDWRLQTYREMVSKAKEIADSKGLKVVFGLFFKKFTDAPHVEMLNWQKM